MDITITVKFTDDDKSLLASILGTETDVELAAKFSKITTASAEEYKKMILGQKVFTRGKDIMEFRLFNLVKHYFDGQIPSEQEISDLFQTTTTESRALVRAITAKYQYELKVHIMDTLKKQFAAGVEDNESGDYYISLQSQFLVDQLNNILKKKYPDMRPIEKKVNTTAMYVIKAATHHHLVDYFNNN